jgi:hypothetical protein
MDRAARLSMEAGDAALEAAHIFEDTFGEEVGEEAGFLEVGTAREQAFSLFNDFVTHGENLCGGTTTKDLVNRMVLMMTDGR